MTSDLLKQFLNLRSRLESERKQILTRLEEISAALHEGPSAKVGSVASPRRARRRVSPATRAKMRAAQRARWGSAKAEQAPASRLKAKARKTVRRKLSAAARARLSAAATARWAKARAAGKTSL